MRNLEGFFKGRFDFTYICDSPIHYYINLSPSNTGLFWSIKNFGLMRIIIAGAGEVGFHLAKLLSYESQDIILIDPNRESLKQAEAHLDIHGTWRFYFYISFGRSECEKCWPFYRCYFK